MNRKRNFYHNFVLILLLILIAVLLFEFAAFFLAPTRQSRTSAYRSEPLWSDITLCRGALEGEGGYEVENICFTPSSLDAVKDPGNALFLAVGPEREYTSAEVSALSRFVVGGGSMIVADDSGRANSLRENAPGDSPLRGSSKYMGDTLLSLDCDRNPRLVKVEASMGEQEYSLLLNDPTALDRPAEEVIAESSINSWIDGNSNEVFDPLEPHNEKYDNYVIIEQLLFEKGNSALFIADSSIFINDMWGRADNSRFILDYVYSVMGGNGTVIIDESIHDDGSLLSGAATFTISTMGYLCNSLPFMIIGGAVIGIMGMLLFIRAKRVKRRPHGIQATSPVLLELKDPIPRMEDMLRLRTVLYDLLCIEYDLDYRYFWDHPDRLDILIRDYALTNFVRYPYGYGPGGLDEVLERCRSRWMNDEGFVRTDIIDLDELFSKIQGGISATGGFGLDQDSWRSDEFLREGQGWNGKHVDEAGNILGADEWAREYGDTTEQMQGADEWAGEYGDTTERMQGADDWAGEYGGSSERMRDTRDLAGEKRTDRESRYRESANPPGGNDLVGELFPERERYCGRRD